MVCLLYYSVTPMLNFNHFFSPSFFLRGCSELYRIPMVEYKVDSEGTPCEYKTPFRRNTTWHRMPTSSGPPLSRNSPTQAPDRLQCQQILQQHQAVIPRSTSFDRKLPDGSRWDVFFPATQLLICMVEYRRYIFILLQWQSSNPTK